MPLISQASNLQTPALTSLYKLLTKYTNFLMWATKFEVFVDISIAFDKVRHKDLIFKLKQNGISVKLLNSINDFLKNRRQRVDLNGQFSSWADVNAGVPQGSILRPLLFLMYIDVKNDLSSSTKHLADDT